MVFIHFSTNSRHLLITSLQTLICDKLIFPSSFLCIIKYFSKVSYNNKRSIDNIVRVERKFDNTFIYFSDGLIECVEHSIDELEQDFTNLEFWRVHPNHLINPDYFNRVISNSNKSIVMQDGTELPVNKDMIHKKQWNKRINNSRRDKLKKFLTLSTKSKTG